MRVITLITDFGTRDYYVSFLKGHILKADATYNIVDISHEVGAHDIMDAAFYLKASYSRFPLGTIHIVTVNTYYGSESKMIVFAHEGYLFIGPNNGIFSLAFENLEPVNIFELDTSTELDFNEVIELALARLGTSDSLNALGNPIQTFEKKISLQPVINSDQIRATIIYIDNFGNVIVNLSREIFEKIRGSRNFAIYYKKEDPITSLSNRYNNVQVGDVCAFFNSINFLEIAVHMGNANELLGLNKNETIHIDFFNGQI